MGFPSLVDDVGDWLKLMMSHNWERFPSSWVMVSVMLTALTASLGESYDICPSGICICSLVCSKKVIL